MVIKGIVENIVFQNPDNNFTVVRVSCNKELITMVGKISTLYQGQEIEATGEFRADSRWGEQFAISSYQLKEPNNKIGIMKYLSSGLIRGVGIITAQKIVDKFGLQTLDIIELNPLKLSEVSGVTKKKAAEIGQAFLELRRMQDTVMFLQKYELSTNLAMKIYEKYGDEACKIVQSNPYKLVEDLQRIGFRTADKIAISLGIEKDSDFRLRAGILHILKESSDRDGNTFLPITNLIQDCTKLLEIDLENNTNRFDNIINQLIIDDHIKKTNFNDTENIMLMKYYKMELKVASKLLNLIQNSTVQHFNLSREIAHFEEINKVSFHQDQKSAIEIAVNNGVSVITGGPGTGKTTIIKCILSILAQRKNKISLLAPTGRAAKRLSESCNEVASTIHRALMIDFHNGNKSETEMFCYNETNKYPYDVIIVDEVSMVDISLMYALLAALRPGTRLIMVGDSNQLPSVGAGNVLADILKSGVVPCCCLTKIYRQSEASMIIKNAHAINNGEMPLLDNKSKDFFFESKQDNEAILATILQLTSVRIAHFLDISPLKIQVLAPMKSGTCGVDNINNNLQNILNPYSVNKPEVKYENVIFRLGDKVMQTANSYNLEWKKFRKDKSWDVGEGVFNGDIGFVTDIHKDTDSLEISFDDGRVADYNREDAKQLALSYAITIHKSQGSEFDVVIIPIIAGAGTILTRNLIYTAVTRAKRMVVLVGQKKNLYMMINNNYTTDRFTALSYMLKSAQGKMEKLFNE